MNKTIKFALREYFAAVRSKGFIIGLIIAPVVMGGGLLAFFLLKDNVDITEKRVTILDHTDMVAETIIETAEYRNENEIYDKESGEQTKPVYTFDSMKPDYSDLKAQRLELSNYIKENKLYAFLEIGPEVVHPGENRDSSKISFYSKNASVNDLRNWVVWPINNFLRKQRLAEAGVDESTVPDLFYWVSVDGMELVTVDEKTGDIQDAEAASPIVALAVPIGMMMLMFMMIMFSVPGMLHSVMEEKTQRIAEVLLGSITPFQFMMGKLIGGIAISITSSSVYFIAAIATVSYMGFENYIPYNILPWFFINMFLAVIMFGAISAALGSTCSEAKDAQSLSFPSLLPALVPMFIYFPVAKEPMSNFSTIVSLIPPFTPMLMTLRLTTPEDLPLWQPVMGLIGVLLFTLFMVWSGSRIFRVAILTQGMPPKLSNMVKWIFKG